jgi:hypothetical protein
VSRSSKIECQGAARNHDAFSRAADAFLGRSIKKYLRKNPPSRPESGPPQEMHAIALTGSAEASMRVIWYFAPQTGQTNATGFCISGIWRSAVAASNKQKVEVGTRRGTRTYRNNLTQRQGTEPERSRAHGVIWQRWSRVSARQSARRYSFTVLSVAGLPAG